MEITSYHVRRNERLIKHDELIYIPPGAKLFLGKEKGFEINLNYFLVETYEIILGIDDGLGGNEQGSKIPMVVFPYKNSFASARFDQIDIRKAIDREEIVRVAREIGSAISEWRHGQYESDRFADCASFCWKIGKNLGLNLKKPENYSRNQTSLKRELDSLLVPIKKEEIKPGSVGLFRIEFGGEGKHIGVFTENSRGLYMIHCDSSRKPGSDRTVGVKEISAKFWLRKLVQAYDFPGAV